ncbi:RecX family transcriptional regulator [Patescibacteria group bacterium]|nr:RecX family transcriptional regulator [Patescibacteria group bacterium]
MPRITKLKAQKNRNRVNLYLDGEYATSLDLLTVTKLGLKVGMDISQTELKKLVRTHQYEKLLNRAAHFLSYRPRSEKELRTYLQRKWRPETNKEKHTKTLEKVIGKLKKQGVVNDQEFAEWWVQQRQTFRPKGKILLTQELRQKGIDGKIIEKALTTLDDYTQASNVAEKKRKSLRGLEPNKSRLRLISFLQRRGFTWETIRRVIDESIVQE